MPIKSFDQLNFGYLDAKHEAEWDERLLTDGYFDLHDAYRTVLEEPKFLVLGYKGCGKSALAHHIKLSSEKTPEIIARTITLNELSYSDFSAVLPGDRDWHARYPKVWSLALLLQLMDLLGLDKQSPSIDSPEYLAAANSLRGANLLPAKSIADAIREYVDHPLAASPSMDAPPSSGRMAALTRLNKRLEEEVLRFETTKRIMLIVDGTDEIFTGDPTLLEVLAALVEAANRLNGTLRASKVRAKVVILCRSDLYAQLPGSNMHKLRTDMGIRLDWYENSGDPATSALARLANRRARMLDATIENIFSDYFPKRIRRGKGSQPIIRLLLEYTRHTPRDFLQLLNAVRDVAKERGTGTEDQRLSVDVVRRGMTQYSKEYFAGTIQDELWGHLSQQERAAIVPLLTSIGTIRFSRAEFLDIANANYPELDPTHLLQVLFECSALGNVRDIPNEGGRGRPRYIFKYRNPDATLNLHDDLCVHKGWRHKLSILDDLSQGEFEDEPETNPDGGVTAKALNRKLSQGYTPSVEEVALSDDVATEKDSTARRRRRRRRGGRGGGERAKNYEPWVNTASETSTVSLEESSSSSVSTMGSAKKARRRAVRAEGSPTSVRASERPECE